MALARRARAASYCAWIGQLDRAWSGEPRVKQSPSAIALALLAARAALRAAARLPAERSIGAGPVHAGFAVVLCDTGTMGAAGRVRRCVWVWLVLLVLPVFSGAHWRF